MTSTEFSQWFDDLTTRFPSVVTWLGKVATGEEARRSMLRTWREVLAAVGLLDALEVNRRMQAGELPWVGEYDNDKERLPQHVRRHARQIAWQSKPQEAYDRSDIKPTSFPAGKIIRRILAMVEGGATPAEAKVAVLAEMPVGNPTWEHRFRCATCHDVGMVTVASPTAIRMALAGTFHECHHREGAVLCTCRRTMPTKVARVVYDADQDYRVTDYLWSDVEVSRFHDWCEDQRKAHWHDKRESAFDSFNAAENF